MVIPALWLPSEYREEVLNSLTISYSVNGEDQEPYSWSGSLPFGEREQSVCP